MTIGNTIKRPFPAYDGDEPYIFISYAHKDANLVFPEIKKFYDEGYPIWYDQGLTPGQEWDDEIAEALMACSLLVVFISENSMASTNVQDEIKLALNERIDIVPIYFEETNLPAGLKLRLSNKHAIMKYLSTEKDYLTECFKAFDKFKIPKNRVFEDSAIPEDDKVPVSDAKAISHSDKIPFQSEVHIPNSNLINAENSIHDFFDGLVLYDDKFNGHYYKEYLLACLDNFMRNPNSYNAFEFYRMFFGVYRISLEDKSAERVRPNYDYDYPNRVFDAVRLAKRYFKNHDVLPHCLNVFILGLAIYSDNEKYRTYFKNHVLSSRYRKHYRTAVGELSDEEFFYRWGIVSLLHNLFHAFPGLDASERKSFLNELKDILGTDTPIGDFFDLNLIPAINPNDSRFIDLVRPLRILSKRISEDFGVDLKQTYMSLDRILAYLKEKGIFDGGVFSAMLVLLLYGKSIQDNSKDPDFFIYPVVDSALAIFLHHVYRNHLQEDFDLDRMKCSSSPLAYLLILCSEILVFDSADIEYGGDLKFIFNVGGVSKGSYLENGMADYLHSVLNIADISKRGIVIDEMQYSKLREFKMMDCPGEELECSDVAIKICERLAQEFHRDLNSSVSFADVPSDLKLSQIIGSEKWISGMNSIGYEVVSEDSGNLSVVKFTEPEIEVLSKWRHEKFREYRSANGWSYGPERDNEKLTDPFLVLWEDLPRNVQKSEIDFIASGKIFTYLNSMGYIVADSKTMGSSEIIPEFRDYSSLFY